MFTQEVQKRILKNGESSNWYGRRKIDGAWRWVRLFTDKRASQHRWNEIIREAEYRAAGVVTPHMEHAQGDIAIHLEQYKAALKRISSDGHYRIATKMLDRFFALAGWKILADVNETSATVALNVLAAEGKTVAYRNQYLARVKAFLNWCIPERLVASPLAKMKRENIRKARKVRARRPLSDVELAGLLKHCGPDRRLKYAIPAYSGLRRKELGQILWGDLHLTSTIPFIRLRPEITKTGEGADLPLHPYLAEEFRRLPQAMPGVKLFATLPEGRTMLRDLKRAGITQTDELNRRADYHALRHCFAKRLDETGCSHATRRALLRHGSGDQTDGYTLARMKEMFDAVRRLPAPSEIESARATMTGTHDAPVDIAQVDTEWTRNVPPSSAIVRHEGQDLTVPTAMITRKNQGIDRDCPESSSIALSEYETRDILAEQARVAQLDRALVS